MNIITIEPSVRENLDMLKEVTQVRDPDGRVLGYFLPESSPDLARYLARL